MKLPNVIAPWKRQAQAWYKKDNEIFEGLYNAIKDDVVCPHYAHFLARQTLTTFLQSAGNEQPCFTSTLVKQVKRHGLSDHEAAWLSATIWFVSFIKTNNFKVR